MISIPGSLSFVMSSAPAKLSVGDARYASQDPFIHGKSTFSHTFSIPIRIRKCVLPSSNAITKHCLFETPDRPHIDFSQNDLVKLRP